MRKVALGIVVVGIVLFALGAVAWAQAGSVLRPDLKQPFLFPHKTHTTLVGLDCTFCHRGTTTLSPATAGYPALEQCMFCHKAARTESPRIQQVRAAYEGKQPLNWVRVYLLPDHVHFVHEPHIRAGFDCAACHGNVKEMDQVEQATIFRMGVCLDCHRQNNARTDCSVCHY